MRSLLGILAYLVVVLATQYASADCPHTQRSRGMTTYSSGWSSVPTYSTYGYRTPTYYFPSSSSVVTYGYGGTITAPHSWSQPSVGHRTQIVSSGPQITNRWTPSPTPNVTLGGMGRPSVGQGSGITPASSSSESVMLMMPDGRVIRRPLR